MCIIRCSHEQLLRFSDVERQGSIDIVLVGIIWSKVYIDVLEDWAGRVLYRARDVCIPGIREGRSGTAVEYSHAATIGLLSGVIVETCAYSQAQICRR